MTTVAVPSLAPLWHRALWPFVALLLALLGLYWSTAHAMVQIWSRSETFAHAFVVPPISLWLIWRQRETLRDLVPQPLPWMMLPMAGVALVWMLGDLVAANAVTQLSLTAMIVLTVPAVLGWQVTRALAFPLAFLFFAVPVGEVLTPVLMQWTADFTVLALRASGIPVYREGLQFVIPSGSWSVVEACSGIRYLMASFMVGSLFAYLNYKSLHRRMIFVAVSIVMPVVANWVRAYMIVMLGHLSNNKIATGADHLLYGWVFFGIVILGMFFIGARWAEPDAPLPVAKAVDQIASAAAARARVWPVALGAAVLLMLPHVVLPRLGGPSLETPPHLSLPPTLSRDWVSNGEATLAEWHPVFDSPSVETSRVYARPDGVVGVHLAYFRAQTSTRKLVNSNHTLVRSTDFRWNHLSSGRHELKFSDARPSVILRSAELLSAAMLERAERPHLRVWQVYWVGGELTSSDVKAKLLSAWQRLSGRGDESATLLIYALEQQPGAAVPLLEVFLRENYAMLDATLREAARSGR